MASNRPMIYVIFCKYDGFRRAGRVWKKGVNKVPVKDLKKEQLKALQNDPAFEIEKRALKDNEEIKDGVVVEKQKEEGENGSENGSENGDE